MLKVFSSLNADARQFFFNASDSHFCYLIRKSLIVSVYTFSSSVIAFLESNVRGFAMHTILYVVLFMLVLLMSLWVCLLFLLLSNWVWP